MHLCPFINVLSLAVFRLQLHSSGAMAEAGGPTSPNIFILGPFTENIC